MSRFEICVGNGKGHNESVTTELNERIMKHFYSFCNID